MSRVRRVHHPDAAASDTELILGREESHHTTRVLRLVAGDFVGVFDGRGREWEGVLQSIHGGQARVRLGKEITEIVDPAFQVSVYPSVCRNDRMEWMIQKSTEVGVSAIHPIVTERVELRAPPRERVVRWRRIALEACKQCGRRRIPTLEPVDGLPPPGADGVLPLILTAGPVARPMADYLSRGRPDGVQLAVGPEGGFTDSEVEAWIGRGWLPASLGPRTLRTETAGVVAATLVLHAWGDLG